MVKKHTLLAIISIIIILLVAAFVTYKYSPFQQTAFPSSNCDFVPNPENLGSEYSQILNDISSFKCEYDECIVSGSLVLDNPTIETGIFNFCPQNNLDYKYCTGDSNAITGIGTRTTDTYKMLKNETLSFNPKYTNGLTITEKSIRVKNYNCSVSESLANLITQSEYSLGREVVDITIELKPIYGMISNVPVDFILTHKASALQVGKRVSTTTNNNGKAVIDCRNIENCFDYKTTISGIYTITAIISPNSNPYIIEQDVNVKPGLRLILTCPIVSEVNLEVECRWLIKDDVTEEFISGLPQIEILQAGKTISYNSIGTSGVRFKTNATGSVDVYVTVSKPGYSSDQEYAQVSIQPQSNTQRFFINNRDYFLYTTGIDIGMTELKLKVEQNNVAVPIQHISTIIQTPSGEEVPIDFVTNPSGWIASYNFQQSGHTYHLTGEITFVDTDIPNQLIKYDIVTTSITGSENSGTITYMVIGISISIIIFIGLIILIISKRGKKKKFKKRIERRKK